MSSSLKKRFFSPQCENEHKETFSLGSSYPNKILNPELAEEECGKQDFIVVAMAIVALVALWFSSLLFGLEDGK